MIATWRCTKRQRVLWPVSLLVMIILMSGCRAKYAFLPGYELESRRIEGGLELIVAGGAQEVVAGTSLTFWARCKLHPRYVISWDLGEDLPRQMGQHACGYFPYGGLYSVKATCRNEQNHYAESSVLINVRYMNSSPPADASVLCQNVIK